MSHGTCVLFASRTSFELKIFKNFCGGGTLSKQQYTNQRGIRRRRDPSEFISFASKPQEDSNYNKNNMKTIASMATIVVMMTIMITATDGVCFETGDLVS